MKSSAYTGAEAEAGSRKDWPYCEFLDAQCLAHFLAQRLGTQSLTRLLTFSVKAEPGARLTLQRNQTGFTVQITNAVESTQGTRLEIEDFMQLGDLLSGSKGVKE